MKHVMISATMLVALAGCETTGTMDQPQPDSTATGATPATETRPTARSKEVAETKTAAASPPSPKARTVEDFDTTSKTERVEAVQEARSEGGRYLGLTITSLGDATESGIWMKTPLVSKPGKGRVEYPATGASVAVDLLPLKGPKSSGSQLSLAAFRLIKAPITGLPELKVYKAGG